MITKNYLKLALWLLVLLFTGGLKAQDPIVIQAVLAPPYPVYYSDIVELPGFATIIVQNTDMNHSYTLRFRMKMDGQNGVTLMLTEKTVPTNPVTIGPGEVKTLSGDDMAFVYHDVDADDIVTTGIDVDKVLQSQRIPDGFYNLCVQAFDNSTLKPLSGSEPTGCSNKMIITTLEPPVIQSPVNEAEIAFSDPQQILMRWTAVNSPTSAMLYDIRLVEVPDGITPYDAMRTDNLLFFEEKDYPATVYSYGPAAPALVSGKRYALQISAHSSTDNANIRNDGKSDIVTFRYMPPAKSIGPAFACSDPCPSYRPPVNHTNIENLQGGDVISIGGFQATLTEVQKLGDRFTGRALLNTSSFFVFPVWMEFENISVNTDYEVYAGKLKAEKRDQMLQLSCYDEDEGFLPQSDADMAEIYNLILNPARAITIHFGDASNPGLHAGVSLPVGYGETDKNIAITKMELTPVGARMNLIAGYTMAGDFRNGAANFVFGIKNVCVTPGGPASGNTNSRIVLLRDVDYFPNNNYTLRFKGGSVRSGNSCYGDINCDGLVSVHLAGEVSFDRNLLLPENENGQIISDKSLAGKFTVETNDPNDWIARVEFTGTTGLPDAVIAPLFRINGLDNYSFNVNRFYLDNSLNSNPPNARFPNGYLSGDANTWQGVFIDSYQMRMPNYFNEEDSVRIRIEGSNFIYDDQGYSFKLDAAGLLTREHPGMIGSWPFTINSFHLEMLRGEMQQGSMAGGLKFDIASNYISYEAGMRIVNNRTRYNFDVHTDSIIEVEMWSAKLNLDPSTSIRIRIDDQDISAEALLSGKISLNDEIDGIPGINIKGVEFTDLGIYSHPPYLSNATFNLDGDLFTFNNFEINLQKVGIESPVDRNGVANPNKKALKIDMNLKLGDEDNGFAAGGAFQVKAKKEAGSKLWSYDGVDVDSISLDGEVPSVKVTGVLNWYNHDAIYGNGFRGVISATFLEKYALDANMLFGNKDNYEYWYVDGTFVFGSVVPIVGSLGLVGFGGGAYYNMEPKGTYSAEHLGNPHITQRYEPVKNGWGMKALVIMSTTDQKTLSGIAEMELSFRGHNLTRTRFAGKFAFLRPPDMGSNSGNDDPMLKLSGSFDYSRAQNRRFLDARLSYDINMPKSPRFLWGSTRSQSVVFHDAGAGNWYLFIGQPSDMLNLQLGFDYKLFKHNISLSAGVSSYFCAGSGLPAPPPIPSDAPAIIRDIEVSDPTSDNTSGVMMGIHAKFGMPKKKAFEIWGNGVSFQANAGLGFDASMRHISGALCNGSEDFGVNNWRAEAKGYLYGYAKLRGKIVGKSFNILDAHFAASMQTILPNPSYFGAAISFGTRLPVYGGFTVKTSFKAGESCEYEMDDNFMDEIALAQLISGMSLGKEVDSVYAYDKGFYVATKLNVPVGRIERYDLADGSVLKTKVGYEVQIYRKINDMDTEPVADVDLRYNSMSRRDQIKLSLVDQGKTLRVYIKDGYGNALLEPGKTYGVKVRAMLMYAVDNDPYRVLQTKDGKSVIESKHIFFVTKKRNNERIHNVVSSVPAVNERFFYLGDYDGENAFHLTYSNDSLFDAYGSHMRLFVEYRDVFSGEKYYTRVSLNKREKTIRYSMPKASNIIGGRRVQGLPLQKGRIYEITFYTSSGTEMDVENAREIYKYYCRTSAYNTLREKYNDMRVASKRYILSSAPLQKYINLKFELKEAFGTREISNSRFQYRDMYLPGTNSRNSWAIQRRLLESYARVNHIDYSFLSDEFVIKRTRYRLPGALTMADVEDARLNGYDNMPRIRLEVDWRLNSYTHALWIIVKLYQDSHSNDNASSGNSSSNGLSSANNNVNQSPQWSQYSALSLTAQNASSFVVPPYTSSPGSFDAKLLLRAAGIINFSMRSSGGGYKPNDLNTGGGKTGNGKDENGKTGSTGGTSKPGPGK